VDFSASEFFNGIGRKRNGRFQVETVESCRFARIVPAGLFRPVQLAEIRSACARSSPGVL